MHPDAQWREDVVATLDGLINDCVNGITEHARQPYVSGETQIGAVVKQRRQRSVDVRVDGAAYRVTVTMIPTASVPKLTMVRPIKNAREP